MDILKRLLGELEFRPESLPSARNRYADAVEKIYNIGRIRAGMEDSPHLNRDNVFDFDTGLRIVISIDYAPLNPVKDRGPFEHVQGVFLPEQLHRFNSKRTPFEEFMRVYYYMARLDHTSPLPVLQDIDKFGTIHMLFPRRDKLDEAKRLYELDLPDNV